jgi:hypothetical protein
MAVLASGKIILQGNPIALTDTLNGQIWRKSVSQAEAVEIEKNMPVISKRLFAGQTVVHILAQDAPEGFESAPANLEDVYFSTLHSHRKTSQNKAA